jgi:choline dehydrogenase-like flavoprotein
MLNVFFLLECSTQGDPIYLHRIPGLAPLLLHWPQHDWNYETVPQLHACKGSANNVCIFISLTNSKRDAIFPESQLFVQFQQVSIWPRGKALGGSSNLNYMLYVRNDVLLKFLHSFSIPFHTLSVLYVYKIKIYTIRM